MKKITLLFLFGFLWSWSNYGQVTIGEQSGTTSSIPITSCWNFSYTQQLIYQSEINAVGDITSISFLYSSGAFDNSTGWTVYMGHTAKTEFTTTSDWVGIADLTQVYTGTVTYPASGQQIVITFDTPFPYNNTSNLVVAIDENQSGYNCSVNFGRTASLGAQRSIYYYSDTTNPNPAAPPAASSRLDYINNLILGGIQQSCPNPTALVAANVSESSADLSWTSNASQSEWEVLYGLAGFNPATEGTTETVSTNPEFTLTGLTDNTLYEFYVTAICGPGDESGMIGPESFRTSCFPGAIPFIEGFESGYTDQIALGGCWSQSSIVGTTSWMANSTLSDRNRGPRTGSWNIYLRYGNEDWIFYPLDLTGGTPYELRFYARQDGAIGGNASIMAAFGTSGDPAAMTNSIVASSPLVNGDYQEFSGFFTPPSSGTYFIGIKGTINSTPWYISMDDISVQTASGCLSPGGLAVANITEASADVSWTESGTATEWEVLYGITGFDPVTEGTTITATINPEITIPGLADNTKYDFYVTAICGVGDESNLAGPMSFTTLCSFTSIPYVMDFETAVVPALPECTTRENAGTGNDWVTATYTSGGFNGKVLKYGYNSNNAANAWFYTQGIELIAGTAYQISYMYGNNSTTYTEKMKVSYGTSPVSTAMTNLLADHPNITGLNNATVSDVAFTVAADGVYYFGFNAYSDANLLNLYLDDINVDIAPTCPAPTAPLVLGITPSSADIAWSPGLSETEWEVVYGLANFDPQTEGDTVTVYTDPETTLVGLQADTNYEFYVRAICGVSDESILSSVGSFFTGYCQVSYTYTGDYLSSVNSTGAVTNISYTATSQPTGGYANETGQLFEASAAETINVMTTYVGGTNGVNVWVDWNNNMQFDESEKVSSPVNSDPKVISITVPAGTSAGDYRMRVRAQYSALPPPCGNVSFGSTVDFNLTVLGSMSCSAPTDLLVFNITGDSADVSWTAGGTETEWKVLYGETGFDPTNEGTEVTVNNDPEVSITGLLTSTVYDVYVKSVCGVGDESDWVGPESFTAVCGSFSMPWSEDFESGTVLNNIVPDLACWAEEFVTEQNNWKFVSANGNNTVTPHSGALMAEFRVASFSLPATKLVTPAMNLTSLNSAQLTFYFANASWGSDIDELRVYYKQSASDPDWTMIPGAEYTTEHASWEKVELILPGSSGATDYVIAFEATSQYARGLNLDDISIGESPSCPAPTALAVNNVTQNSADVSWTAGLSETQWEVLYGITGFDPATQGIAITVNTDPETTIPGLELNTAYDFYVTAICGVGNESDMVGPMSFTTLCGSTTVPYVMDFETAVVPDIPECTTKENVGTGNDWVTQVYNLNGMSGNVLRYGYHSTNPANAWFYTQGIELQVGVDYEISYKYFGSSTWPEKMKVAYGTSPQSTEMTEQLADYPNIGAAGDETVAFTVAADGVYYFGFNAYSDANQNYLYVDDINIIEVVSSECDAATDVAITEITESGATVSWTASPTATEGYEVNVYLEGGVPGTDTPVATETVAAGVTTVDVNGLEPDTSYDVYVTSDCGDGNTALSDVVNFSTNQIGIDDNNLAKVNYFPNPVKDQLTITSARSIENVTIYNLLGQPVLQVQPRAMNVVLDMSTLPTGTYVLKANVVDAVSTFKVIKE